MHPSQRSFGLDLARALAIGLVITAHFAKVLETAGRYGVELFFALSGFLIGGILYRDLFSTPDWTFAHVTRFWQRRWWRTLPNYYLFFALNSLFHLVYGGFPSPQMLWRYPFFLQNVSENIHFFYGVSWSLCVEEWFYLLFPGLLWLAIAGGVGKRTAFVFLTLLFLIAPPLLRQRYFLTFEPETVRALTAGRLDAIFYGVAMAFLNLRFRPGAIVTRRAALVGAALVTAIYLGHAYRDGSPASELRLAFLCVPCGFALMMPWLERLAAPAASFSFLQAGIEKLSLWSYSIYLCHIPILFTVYAISDRLGDSAAIKLAAKGTALALTLAVARFVYRRFEIPMISFRPPQLQPALAAA